MLSVDYSLNFVTFLDLWDMLGNCAFRSDGLAGMVERQGMETVKSDASGQDLCFQ